MNSLDINIHIFICVLFMVPELHADCPYQECQCEGTYIECQTKGLTVFPHLGNGSAAGLLTLTLDDNQITAIPANSFPPGLTEVSIFNNPITTIDDSAFDVLSSTLETLYFSGARFTRIPDALIRLDVLQHLNLYDAPIEDWNADVMAHLGKTMQTLNLGNDSFTSWPNWIQNFSSLQELNIPDSFIPSIPDDALDHLANTLFSLTISNNSLTTVPKTLSKLTSLGTLDLHGNRLINVTWLPPSNNLMLIWLQDNKLFDAHQLSTVLNSSSKNISSLTISKNKLAAIPNLSFLKDLNSLDLSQNLISDPTSGSVPPNINQLDFTYNILPSIPMLYKSLRSIDFVSLSNNAVQELREADLPIWVIALNLGFNLISALTDSSFPKGSSLSNLYLNNNPISFISDQAFVELRSLSWLNLQETKIARLPLGLVHLTGLRSLNLNNCPSLVCTCEEKTVGQNITAHSSIEGKCGELSIYEFYRTLSIDCP